MSRGVNCEIVEVREGAWYYILENQDAPETVWDWREHASAYGPFETYKAARADLRNHQASPGWHAVYSVLDADVEWSLDEDTVLATLIEEATIPNRSVDTGRGAGVDDDGTRVQEGIMTAWQQRLAMYLLIGMVFALITIALTGGL